MEAFKVSSDWMGFTRNRDLHESGIHTHKTWSWLILILKIINAELVALKSDLSVTDWLGHCNNIVVSFMDWKLFVIGFIDWAASSGQTTWETILCNMLQRVTIEQCKAIFLKFLDPKINANCLRCYGFVFIKGHVFLARQYETSTR